MQVVNMRIADVVPYENNPRHNENAVEAVANSIMEFGWKQPIVVDKDNVVIVGHTRLKAAQKLGLVEVPVLIADDLTPEKVKAYRLADNKTNELAFWDEELLDIELGDITDIDMTDFGFSDDGSDWFDRKERDGAEREEGNDEYNEFLEKFEAKKTTDDCYTPDVVYNAVAEWVAQEYGANRDDFVRPFYPGGDYQAYKYKSGAVVVDNPPFSILAQIVKFYVESGIRFFLFAPTLTLFSSASAVNCCSICVGVAVTYENGANVNTSFLTNLEGEFRARSAPTLYRAIKEANDANLKEMHRELPKYSFPDYVITSTRCGQFSRYGIDFCVPTAESEHIRQLDAQKDSGKAVFGGAFLLSERMKNEKEKAEREKAERLELSEREMEIVRSLGKV